MKGDTQAAYVMVSMYMAILLLMVVSTFGAVSRSNLILALDCENNVMDSRGLFGGTNNGASFISGPYGDLVCDFTEPDSIAMGDKDGFTIAGGSGTDIPFTVSYWIAPDVWGDPNLDMYILEKFGTPREFLNHLSGGTDQLRFTLYDSSDNFIRISATISNLSDGTWHHVVFTYDGSESETGLKVFIDHYEWSNIVQFESGVYTGMSNGAEGLDLFSDDGTNSYVNGSMDMLYIWKGVNYNQTEVSELYNSGLGFDYPFISYEQTNFSWDFSGNSAGSFTVEEDGTAPTVLSITSNRLEIDQPTTNQWAHVKTAENATINLSDFTTGNGSILMVNFTLRMPTAGAGESGCFGVWHNNSGWTNTSEPQATPCYGGFGEYSAIRALMDEETRLIFVASYKAGVSEPSGQCQILGMTGGSTYYVKWFTVGLNSSAYMEVYTDSTFTTLFQACAITLPSGMANNLFTHFSAFEANTQAGFDDWGAAAFIDDIKFSSTRFNIADTLSILQNTYNATSAYLNATAWRTNTSATVFTYDATPTVTFELTRTGNCTISREYLNYTEMLANDANTLCATTDVASQSCTLPITKRLYKGVQDIYIACKGTNGVYTNSSNLTIQLDAVGIDNQTYNVTNSYVNGTAWRITENNTVYMRNRMPIVMFNTRFESNCSISTYQLNYTQMVANDSTSDCGDVMNVSHSCELPSSLQLVNDAQFLYLSCLSIGAEPAGGQSTSLPLNISMDRRIVVQVNIQNGTVNSTYGRADVYAVNQADNYTSDKKGVNGTGGAELFVPTAGTYEIHGYDPTNSSVEGDIKNHVVVS